MTPSRSRTALVGTAFAVSAHICWGVVTPFYVHALGNVPATEIIAHRIVWSLLVTLIVLTGMTSGLADFKALLIDAHKRWQLALAALLVAGNWTTFVYAIQIHNLLAASLGYFVTPLVQVALGTLVLRETLRPMQKAAVALAGVSVVFMFTRVESGTWIALALAGTWGTYSLIRRRMNAPAIPALAVECLALLPAGVAIIAWSATVPTSGLRTASAFTLTLLGLAGVVTAVPLLLFGAAARRLPMRALGFTQYIGPTLQFAMAVLLFGEHPDALKLTSFAIIWAALALYTYDALTALRAPPPIDEPS
ncbi:MAG: EamA family transporter RarD [Tepidisphaeraceae bacterium]